jgi:hypothetical protein
MGGRCTGKVSHKPCLDTALQFNYDVETGWALMRHAGFHNHPWPKAKKWDPLARLKLEKTVANNAAAGAFQLKVCFFLC